MEKSKEVKKEAKKEVKPTQEAKKEDKPAQEERKGLELRNLNRYFICSIGKGNNIVRDIINIPYIIQDAQAFAYLENDWRSYKKDPSLSIISFNLLKIEQVVYYDNKPLKEDDIINSIKKVPEEEVVVEEFKIDGLKN